MSSILIMYETFRYLKANIMQCNSFPLYWICIFCATEIEIRVPHKIWSRFVLSLLFKRRLAGGEGGGGGKKSWKIAFLWLTKCQDMQCFKEFSFHIFIFFVKKPYLSCCNHFWKFCVVLAWSRVYNVWCILSINMLTLLFTEVDKLLRRKVKNLQKCEQKIRKFPFAGSKRVHCQCFASSTQFSLKS